MNNLKLLHATDLHFNQQWFEWVASCQKDFDAICLSGDFLDPLSDVAVSTQIQWISNWMKNIKKPLFVCSGNHDIEENDEWLNQINTVYGDNSITTLNEIKIGCIPYIGGDFLEFCDCDIVLYHLPPAKTDTSTDHKGRDWGDTELLRVLKNKLFSPKYLLCGHMHTPKKTMTTLYNTTISNPGSDSKSEIPLHRVIVVEDKNDRARYEKNYIS